MDQPRTPQHPDNPRRLSIPGRDIVVPQRAPQSAVHHDGAEPQAPIARLITDMVPPSIPTSVKSPTMPVEIIPPPPTVSRRDTDRIHAQLTRSARLHAIAQHQQHSNDRKKHTKRQRTVARVLAMRGFRYGLAVIIVVVTGYVGFDIWQTNTALKQDLSKTVSQLGSPNAEAHQDNEGRDETPVLKDAVDSYRVAPSLPRVVTIDKVKVRARVVSMDVNPDNSIQAPINIYDAGWYTGSAKPGEPGAALIDGHASGATRQGLFAYLDTLTVGDVIKVERGDGTRFVYEVVYAEIVNKDEVDMTALLKPYDGVAQGLNLITCTGKYIKDQKTYDHRAIVYTKLVRQELP